ncbi:MAG TPA: hypothetical protein PK718_08140 [Candidatus Methanofastidiosa archaeon]|nr:hypothetical protein [Candidatus Methanofastidiosa archaeon]
MPIEKIKCPSCGSKNVIHVMDGIYVCTYCEQKFEKVAEREDAGQAGPAPGNKDCPVCGKDNSSGGETYLCKLCNRPNVCKDHMYFQGSDNFFACSECMKCALCGKTIDVPYYRKEDITAYCPDCDIVVGMECVKMIEDPALEGYLYYYCPKCGNLMCFHDRFGDEMRAQMVRDGTFKPVRAEDAGFDPTLNYYDR